MEERPTGLSLIRDSSYGISRVSCGSVFVFPAGIAGDFGIRECKVDAKRLLGVQFFVSDLLGWFSFWEARCCIAFSGRLWRVG
jgi:hypothetical protein